MNHILIFIHVISFSLGIIALTLTGIYYFKNNKHINKIFLTTHIFYTLLFLFDLLCIYIRKNVPYVPSSIDLIITICNIIIGIGLIYNILLLLHELIEKKISKLFKSLFFVLSSLYMLIITWLVFDGNDSLKNNIINIALNLYLFFGVLVIILFSFFNFKKICMKLPKKITAYVIALIIFILLSFLLTFMHLPSIFGEIPYSLLLYIYVNIMIITYIYRAIRGKSSNSSIDNTRNTLKSLNLSKDTFNALVLKYHITNRESEIIQLLVKGLNNQEISKELNISINTVRNHIANFFKKVGVKNRYELLYIITQIENDSQSISDET